MVFDSPEPVPIETFDWLGDLPVLEGAFEEIDRTPGLEVTLGFLQTGPFDDEADYLREAAVDIGKTAAASLGLGQNAPVSIRSGLYGANSTIYEQLGFHYDFNPLTFGPGAALLVATGVASWAVVGELREQEVPGEPAAEDESFTSYQARMAQKGKTAYDMSRADIVELNPNVLYLFPAFCVHTGPEVAKPISRNLFRYKIVGKR